MSNSFNSKFNDKLREFFFLLSSLQTVNANLIFLVMEIYFVTKKKNSQKKI